MTLPTQSREGLSLIKGIPLNEEEGIGALTLGGYLKEVTSRFGPREAVMLPSTDGAERWTYDELWSRSVVVARSLLACGAGKGTRVGILMTNRLEFLSAVFGTALAGGVATTLSTFSTPAELKVVLENSGCSILLFERHVLKKDFATVLRELEPKLSNAAPGQLFSETFPYLRHLATVDSEETAGGIEGWNAFLARGESISPELVEATAAAVQPADPGVLFFSSGSTGKPKGILSAHRGVCLQLWRWRKWLGLDQDVRSLTTNGFFWSGNFAIGIGSTLSAGGTLVLQQTFQPEEALAIMEAENVSYIFAWPHQWAQLVDAKNWLDVDLSALKYIDANSPVAGHPTVNSNWIDATHAYGNTETFTLSSVFPANTPKSVSGDSHGIPVAGNTFKIVDPLSGDLMPLGERGEIAVKGPTLMLGYIGIPQDEVLDEEGFFRTGDGGFFDPQGRLHWEGRLNDIIKTGGANVSPVEIDTVIAQCPGVKVTKTVGIPDELLGELVVTCIVPQEGAELSEELVRSFAKEQLASFKVPRRVLLFREDELEWTGSAKVKSSQLQTLAADRLKAQG
ncbi:class I adenylate-forming enzyme family protein [Ketobacter sp.]|uniref:class I adenylate-forming enzyme family protein n=1 Tax=Ketobacter sp. TaxID=2083498 RepID=UPI000F27E3CB|nr:class I adenylate-forming enzyme family protein [Ketobacter sp.]RLT95650.1 MAG: long-chain fatty acid--CoA ligase [Ketobacter sp.]